MMYVPNTIRIPTHGVDLWHHGLWIGERNPKSLMEPLPSQERRRKKEREEEEIERRLGDCWWPSHAKGTGMTESCHVRRCDSCSATRARPVGTTSKPRHSIRRDWRVRGATSVAEHVPTQWVTPVHMAWLLHKSHRMDWHDSKGPNLEKRFGRVHFSNIN
jgi:hypothetical protein